MTDQARTEQIAEATERLLEHDADCCCPKCGGPSVSEFPVLLSRPEYADIRVLLDAVKAERERAEAAEAQLAECRKDLAHWKDCHGVTADALAEQTAALNQIASMHAPDRISGYEQCQLIAEHALAALSQPSEAK